MKNIILIPHSAVGEAVMLSGRARLYHKLGFKVYVSSNSQLKSNKEAFEMLFLKNPYISGQKSEDDGDILDGIVVQFNPFQRVKFNPQILKKKDFERSERSLVLHYTPQEIPSLRKKTILDLNISTYRLREGGRDDFSNVSNYVQEHYPDAISVVRRNCELESRGFEQLPVSSELETLTYDSIYDYCDIVASCQKVVCLQTGSEMLAAFYNGNVECLLTENFVCQLNNDNQLVFIDTSLKVIDLK